MDALIIGAAGFVGGYLIHQLKLSGLSVAATKMPNETMNDNDINIYNLNILDKNAITDLLEQTRPQYIFLLAAQSSVALSWENPQLTIDVNIKGSVNVLEAVRQLSYSPRVLLIGSGEEYGHVSQASIPIAEDTPQRPGNIYAATKACQNMIGKLYADGYNMPVMMVRAFNHFGPKQSPMFVVADFCRQVAEIEKGIREPVIHVGNLSVRRDFTDVRDVVRAYSLLIQKGSRGETYNVGSGNAIEIKEILNKILALSNCPITIYQDDKKFRPSDVPIIEADITKLQECTGWTAEIPLEQTLSDTLNYWRSIV